jgi:hypothetical protein
VIELRGQALGLERRLVLAGGGAVGLGVLASGRGRRDGRVAVEHVGAAKYGDRVGALAHEDAANLVRVLDLEVDAERVRQRAMRERTRPAEAGLAEEALGVLP